MSQATLSNFRLLALFFFCANIVGCGKSAPYSLESYREFVKTIDERVEKENSIAAWEESEPKLREFLNSSEAVVNERVRLRMALLGRNEDLLAGGEFLNLYYVAVQSWVKGIALLFHIRGLSAQSPSEAAEFVKNVTIDDFRLIYNSDDEEAVRIRRLLRLSSESEGMAAIADAGVDLFFATGDTEAALNFANGLLAIATDKDGARVRAKINRLMSRSASSQYGGDTREIQTRRMTYD